MTSQEFNSHSEPFTVLRTILNQEGFRLTDQRQKILEVISSVPEGQHLSAEDIYHRLSATGANIGLSTIYRALHLLVELGLLRELALSEERKLYELCGSKFNTHHHLVCVDCGLVEEFEDAAVLSLGSNEALRKGYSLLDCQFTVWGICPRCAQASTSASPWF